MTHTHTHIHTYTYECMYSIMLQVWSDRKRINESLTKRMLIPFKQPWMHKQRNKHHRFSRFENHRWRFVMLNPVLRIFLLLNAVALALWLASFLTSRGGAFLSLRGRQTGSTGLRELQAFERRNRSGKGLWRGSCQREFIFWSLFNLCITFISNLKQS